MVGMMRMVIRLEVWLLLPLMHQLKMMGNSGLQNHFLRICGTNLDANY